MNGYFQIAVSQCIHRTDGTVVKYIGDAVFAFWNAPIGQVDHPARACEAALLFRDKGVQQVNGVPLYTRIGLHTGVANVGNFGSTERVDYTAFGENINLASRMEGLNKYLGTKVLITGETKAGLGEKFLLRPLGLFRLKGFERIVEVYELLGHASMANETRMWRDPFAQALGQFQRRDFAGAALTFKLVNDLREDGPSAFYLSRIEEFRSEPPPENWKGEIELKEK
jgi:adenylate cyclase